MFYLFSRFTGYCRVGKDVTKTMHPQFCIRVGSQ
jgi:hypothetical protein